MNENLRKYGLWGLGVIGIGIAFTVYQNRENNPQPPVEPTPLSTPTAFETFRIGEQASSVDMATTQPTSGTVVNGMTGAIYNQVPDPTGAGRQCLEIGPYTSTNPQTLVGATVALNNPNMYIDVANGTIHGADGKQIGVFDQSRLPSHADTGGVPAEIVCANQQ